MNNIGRDILWKVFDIQSIKLFVMIDVTLINQVLDQLTKRLVHFKYVHDR